MEYYKGLELICRAHNQKPKLFVNYSYFIDDFDEQTFTIFDDIANEKYTLDKQMLENFTLPYAATCHAVQGLSMGELTTVFDANLPYVDRYWIWVAITRCRDLDKLVVFEHDEKTVAPFTKYKMLQYFREKVSGYKSQDKEARREFNKEEYVSEEWILEQFEKFPSCPSCPRPLKLSFDEFECNFAVDRLDSNFPHHKSNCRLLCNQCNREKANRYISY